jgi:AcrR family transcriptional regulator
MSSDDLRRTVLDASLDLIEERGLAALSMREVARRAGVSHQAPYHHFGDREGILAAIAMDGFSRLYTGMQRAVGKFSDPVARLNAVGGAYVSFAVRHPAHFKIMFRSELVAIQNHEQLHACAEKAFAFVTSIVGEVVASRRGAKDTLPFVIAAWSLAHGAATLLLEGKLDRHYGTSNAKRMAGAIAAIEAFGTLFASENPVEVPQRANRKARIPSRQPKKP